MTRTVKLKGSIVRMGIWLVVDVEEISYRDWRSRGGDKISDDKRVVPCEVSVRVKGGKK